MSSGQVLSLELSATHESVRVARHMIRHFSRMRGVSDRERDNLVLVVSELLANAVDHGAGEVLMDDSQNVSNVKMTLTLVVTEKEWTLDVTDQCGGDAEQLQSALDESSLPDLEDDRGRGLFLLRSSVDRLEVTPSPDGAGLTVKAVRAHSEG